MLSFVGRSPPNATAHVIAGEPPVRPGHRAPLAYVRVQAASSFRLDEIYRYTNRRCGTEQTDRYIIGLFEVFDKIDTRGVVSKPVPAEFAVEGYYFRYERHLIYWRRLSNGDIGIVTILHERMHQIDRFNEDFEQ